MKERWGRKPFGANRRSTRPTRAGLIAALIPTSMFGAACAGSAPSMLDPQGESAKRVEGLWWLMLWVSLAVLVIVVGLMTAAVVRRRHRGTEIDQREPGWGEPFVLVAGVVIPAIVLTAVFVVSVRDMNAITGSDARISVDVIGHMWWWQVEYSNGVVTANEIHIPTGEPVRFEVTSDDVIHSFWIPQLAPKIDMIPGRMNSIVVETDRVGRFRGECAEFCGLQHAHMVFFVIAQPRPEFDRWLRNQALPAAAPSGAAAAGQDVFLSSSCAGCHTIEGTAASATLGPDLTHEASRETLAAGTLENTRENLATWISDPQAVKPGAVMPPTQLSPRDLRSLLDYLGGLR